MHRQEDKSIRWQNNSFNFYKLLLFLSQTACCLGNIS